MGGREQRGKGADGEKSRGAGEQGCRGEVNQNNPTVMDKNLDLLDYLKFGDSGQPVLEAPTQAFALTWVRSRYQIIATWAGCRYV